MRFLRAAFITLFAALAILSPCTPALAVPASFKASNIEVGTITTRAQTLADLQKIPVKDGQIVYLLGRTTAGDGGEGVFHGVSGDQSALVASDPQHGVYAPGGRDGTGGSGVWKRQYSGAVNVRWFGNDTTAFSAAAQSADSGVNTFSPFDGIARAEVARVYVPSGSYTLTSLVDTGGKDIIWTLENGADITGHNYLNGRLERTGQRLNDDQHVGTLDYATTYSVKANNPDLEEPSAVVGIVNASDLSNYTDRDSVAFYTENTAPPVLADVATATYTATTMTPGTPLASDDIKRLRIGMIIDTKHDPKCSGFVTGWASDGSSLSVSGWYEAGGGSVTPSSGVGAYINPFTKAWAHNANIHVTAASHADQAAGFELGVFNDRAAYNPATTSPKIWGYDAVSLGAHTAETAFIQRGTFFNGFESRGATGYGFIAKDIGTVYPGFAAFASKASSQVQFIVQSRANGETTSFLIDRDGRIEMGRQDAAADSVLDMHSSGAGSDYDVRMLSTGGSATNGQGKFKIESQEFESTAGTFLDSAALRPLVDGSRNLGAPSFRWGTIYAINGTISTSDERDKKDIEPITDAVLDAWSEVEFQQYRWKSAPGKIQIGVVAQRIVEAFERNGLNAQDYGLISYDGDRYGINADQCLFLESAWMRRELSALKLSR